MMLTSTSIDDKPPNVMLKSDGVGWGGVGPTRKRIQKLTTWGGVRMGDVRKHFFQKRRIALHGYLSNALSKGWRHSALCRRDVNV